MKRLFIFILIITMFCCMALAGLGIVNSLTKQDLNLSHSVSADIIRIQNEMNDLFLEKETFEENKNGVEERIDELVSSIESMRLERDGYVALLGQINEQLADIESRLVSGGLSQEEIDELYVQKETFEEDKAEIEANISAINNALQGVQTEQESANNNLTELDGYIDFLQIQIDNLQASINELYAIISSINRSVITLSLSNNVSLQSNETKLLEMSREESCGTKLTCSNGQVVIGKDVHYVLVSGLARLEVLNTENFVSFQICQTNTGIVAEPGAHSGKLTNSTVSLTITPRLIAVSEGDNISAQVFATCPTTVCGKTGAWLRTYLTVEVVAW